MTFAAGIQDAARTIPASLRLPPTSPRTVVTLALPSASRSCSNSSPRPRPPPPRASRARDRTASRSSARACSVRPPIAPRVRRAHAPDRHEARRIRLPAPAASPLSASRSPRVEDMMLRCPSMSCLSASHSASSTSVCWAMVSYLYRQSCSSSCAAVSRTDRASSQNGRVVQIVRVVPDRHHVGKAPEKMRGFRDIGRLRRHGGIGHEACFPKAPIARALCRDETNGPSGLSRPNRRPDGREPYRWARVRGWLSRWAAAKIGHRHRIAPGFHTPGRCSDKARVLQASNFIGEFWQCRNARCPRAGLRGPSQGLSAGSGSSAARAARHRFRAWP